VRYGFERERSKDDSPYEAVSVEIICQIVPAGHETLTIDIRSCFDLEPIPGLSVDLGKICAEDRIVRVPEQWTYFEDFETGFVGPEWSNRQVAISPSGQRFLGRLTNGAVTLTLTDLPAHNEATVALDLYLIRSWDGNNPDSGPDIVEFSLGDALLKRTTFSNVHRLDDPHPQAFPGDYPGDSYPAATGASGINTLGYPPGSNRHGDTKYRLEFTAASSSTTLTFTVTASNLQALDDESWGIDNVEVKLR
jgi:hypothetical protein